MSALIGPAAALLYENRLLRVFRSYHIGDAWFVAAVAAVGVGRRRRREIPRPKVAAVVSLVVNAAVLTLYAFIAEFFTLGGPR